LPLKSFPYTPRKIRPYLAYLLVFGLVSLILFNFITDGLVTRYENHAAREPDSPYLKGMAPRTLGPADADKAVLFVHGFIGAQSNFSDLPDTIAASGWYVETVRLPGHGTSPRDFERTTADELETGVIDAIRGLKANHETVVVVGHSMGGALSTLAAAQEPIDGLVLCAPYFGLTHHRVLGIPTDWLARRAALVIRWLPGRPGNGPVAKPSGRVHVDCYGWIPTAGTLTALEVRERANQDAVLQAITGPVLTIHSHNDSVTSSEATATAAAKMSNASVKTSWLEKSDHVIFWDYEADQVTREIQTFLKELEGL